MISKTQITSIKLNHERTLQGLRTELKQFYYADTIGIVKPNKLYSVYYTLNKKEVIKLVEVGDYKSLAEEIIILLRISSVL